MRIIKKIFKGALLAIILSTLIGGTVLAAYSYYANIQVQETSGNSYDWLPIIADIDNDYLANNGYISLTGLNTRVLSGSTELKHLVADDKTLFVAPSVDANSTGNYKYTLNNTSDVSGGSFPVITGYNGYITVADDPDLELGNTFEITLSGYINTDAGGTKNLVYKQDSFRTYVSGAEEITSEIAVVTGLTENLAPTAAGSEEFIPDLVDTSHWNSQLTNDGDTSYVSNADNGGGAGTWHRDLYTCQNTAVGAGTINSVTIHIVYKGTSSEAKTVVRTE